jgi:hypothetical protein
MTTMTQKLKTFTVTIDRESDSPVLATSAADAIDRVAGRLPVNEETYTVRYIVEVKSDDGEYDVRTIDLDPVQPSCPRADSHRWYSFDPVAHHGAVVYETRCLRCGLTRDTEHAHGTVTVRYYR